MQIQLSPFDSNQTGVSIHTLQGRRYSTDVFEERIFRALSGQQPDDTIAKLVVHRRTSKQQILTGDLSEEIKNRLLGLL